MAYELIPAAIDAAPRYCLTTPQAMVLVVLANAASSRSRLTWLGQVEIGRLARLSENATRAALRALESASLISALGSKATQSMWKRRLPTIYLVHPDCAPAALRLDRAVVEDHLNQATRLGHSECNAVIDWLLTMGALGSAAPIPAANAGNATCTRSAELPAPESPSYPHEVKANQLLNQELNQGEARDNAPTGQDGAKHDRSAPFAAGNQLTAHRLPADWAPPPIDDLPPQARALVLQWPSGAYQAVCETFRLHWTAESGARAAKRDWGAALGKWLVNDHGKVMRDARAGVNFAQLAPAAGSGAAWVVHQPVDAKAWECHSAQQVHQRLVAQLGQAMWAQWINPCAIILAGEGATVICPSAFVRDWVQERFEAKIRQTIDEVAQRTGSAIRFEVATVRAFGAACALPMAASAAA